MSISNSDYSTLQEGDKVLIVATVKYGPDQRHENEVYLSVGYHSMSAKLDDIMGVVSRNFRAGDDVTNGAVYGTILLISGTEIVVKTTSGLVILKASDLTRGSNEPASHSNRLEAAE